MTRRITRDPIYRRRRFCVETIELFVRWYITYRLSYRDRVAMMAEREIAVSHTTIMRWVLKYVPELRATVGALRTSSGFVLAHGRNCRICPWRPALSIPSGG
jgi:transposase-like protein